jgi:hypothetical protein
MLDGKGFLEFFELGVPEFLDSLHCDAGRSRLETAK